MIKPSFIAILILLSSDAVAAPKPFELPPALQLRRVQSEWVQVPSPDGTVFATGDRMGVSIWKFGDTQPAARVIWPLDAEAGEVLPLAISNDNKRVLMSRRRIDKSNTFEVAVADLESEKIIGGLPAWKLRCGSDNMKGIRMCESAVGTFSPDGAAASIRTNYMIEDHLNGYDDVQFAVTGKLLEKKTRKEKYVDSNWTDEAGGRQSFCRYDTAGARRAVRVDGVSCSVIDCGTGKRITFLEDCDALRYYRAQLSDDATRVMAENWGSSGGVVWEAGAGKRIRAFQLQDDEPYRKSSAGFKFDANARYAVAKREFVADGRVQALQLDLVSVDSGERLARREFSVEKDPALSAVAPDGSVAFLVMDGFIHIVPFAPARPAAEIKTAARAPAAPKLDVDRTPKTAAKPDPNAYAVVIGVEKYRQAGIPAVDYAARDAKTMYEYLTESMGFDPQNVISLTDGEATKTDFEKHFGKWLRNRVDAKSRVFVYYAGHGAPNPTTGEGYLMPFEADPAYLDETAYPVARLYSELAKLPTKDVTVVLDACFSGQGSRSLIAKGTRPLVSVKEAKSPAGLVVIAAAAGTQVSASDHAAKHGLLTYHLLAGLQGAADADKDGRINANELFAYARPAVQRAARLQNVDQTPTMSGDGKAGGAWITLEPK